MLTRIKLLGYVIIASIVSILPPIFILNNFDINSEQYKLLVLIPALVSVSTLISLVFYKFIKQLIAIWIMFIVICVGALCFIWVNMFTINKSCKSDYEEFVSIANETFDCELADEISLLNMSDDVYDAFMSNRYIALDLIMARSYKLNRNDNYVNTLSVLDDNMFYYKQMLDELHNNTLKEGSFTKWTASNEFYINVTKLEVARYRLKILLIGLISSLIIIVVDGRLFKECFKEENMTEVERYNYERSRTKENNYNE